MKTKQRRRGKKRGWPREREVNRERRRLGEKDEASGG
jgi:hypothetical protein